MHGDMVTQAQQTRNSPASYSTQSEGWPCPGTPLNHAKSFEDQGSTNRMNFPMTASEVYSRARNLAFSDIRARNLGP